MKKINSGTIVEIVVTTFLASTELVGTMFCVTMAQEAASRGASPLEWALIFFLWCVGVTFRFLLWYDFFGWRL